MNRPITSANASSASKSCELTGATLPRSAVTTSLMYGTKSVGVIERQRKPPMTTGQHLTEPRAYAATRTAQGSTHLRQGTAIRWQRPTPGRELATMAALTRRPSGARPARPLKTAPSSAPSPSSLQVTCAKGTTTRATERGHVRERSGQQGSEGSVVTLVPKGATEAGTTQS